MNDELEWNANPGARLPLPPVLTFWPRLRLRWLGIRDRRRYGDIVKDGSHTHASGGLRASAQRGTNLVDSWENAIKEPLRLELATLPKTAPVVVGPAEAGPAPDDVRARVRWNQSLRVAASARAAVQKSVAQFEQSEQRRQVLEASLDAVQLRAATARERWIADYYERVEIYARHRVSRRGLRPAAEAVPPVYTPLDARGASKTEDSSQRVDAERE